MVDQDLRQVLEVLADKSAAQDLSVAVVVVEQVDQMLVRPAELLAQREDREVLDTSASTL
jgi:hypothetical protein